MILELTPKEYKTMRDNKSPHVLLDVRQPWEVGKASIPGAEHLPFTELVDNSDLFSKDHKIIIYCHHGIRSLNACVFLREKGFKDVLSLAGGIEAWARQVDPTIPLY